MEKEIKLMNIELIPSFGSTYGMRGSVYSMEQKDIEKIREENAKWRPVNYNKK